MSGDEKNKGGGTGHLFDKYTQEQDPLKIDDLEYDDEGRAIKKITPEDIFFHERDREELDKKKKEIEKKRIEEEKKLSHMKCPNCGVTLEIIDFKSVSIERCSECEGVWLNKDQIQIMREKGPIVMTALMKKFFDPPMAKKKT